MSKRYKQFRNSLNYKRIMKFIPIYTIYIHINKTNKKKYVGQTSKPVKERWRNGGRGYRNNKHFWNAIKKYGWNNFDHIIISKNLTKSQADKLEIKLIALWSLTNSEYGYNVVKGGGGTLGQNPLKNKSKYEIEDIKRQHSKRAKEYWKNLNEEELEKINKKRSEKLKGVYVLSNKTQEEMDKINKKISKANTGRKHSGKFKEKMSNDKKEYWKNLNEEELEKIKRNMSKNHADFSGNKHPRARKVRLYIPDSRIIDFDCRKDMINWCSLNLGISHRGLQTTPKIFNPNNCKSKHLTYLNGIYYEYLN